MIKWKLKRKVCRGCHRRLPIAQYYKEQGAKTGYKARCKDCLRVSRRKRIRDTLNPLIAEHNADPSKNRIPPDCIPYSYKQCSACGRILPAKNDEYFPLTGPPTNRKLGTRCRNCRNAYMRQYRKLHALKQPDPIVEATLADNIGKSGYDSTGRPY